MSLTSSLAAPLAVDIEARSARRTLAGVGALAALGVYLMFGHSPGLGAALFVGAVEMAAMLAARRVSAVGAAVGLATLAPWVEDASLLSAAIAACGAAAVALIVNGAMRGRFARMALRAIAYLALGPLNALFDLPVVAARASRGGVGRGAALAWVLPLGLGGVFLALFAAANPVIAGWISALDLSALWSALDVRRIASWLLLILLVWPFVRFGWPNFGPSTAPAATRGGGRWLAALFTDAAILRSLLLFNAMFAVETFLDATILWGGRGLPEGVSFASYAHRGAYPLVVTALLAGAFVALAMREGAGLRSRMIRALVYLWLAQNVALVVSSLYRLNLYVHVYSLTYWRFAAFVWMALVAVGLVLVVVRIAARLSTRWLASANLAACAAALYLVAFVNLDALIAGFNLSHCAEAGGEGAGLDVSYLESLGPEALPALDAALTGPLAAHRRLSWVKTTLEGEHRGADGDWRAWTFRRWRLARRLEAGAP